MTLEDAEALFERFTKEFGIVVSVVQDYHSHLYCAAVKQRLPGELKDWFLDAGADEVSFMQHDNVPDWCLIWVW